MTKRAASIMVACLLATALLCQQAAAAATDLDKDARATMKVKTALLKLGTGPDTRINLQLKDKTRLTGYIREINADSFVVADLSSPATRTIPYPDVVKVKGNNLSKGTKIAIWVAVAAGIAIVLYLVKGAFCDGC